MSGSDLGCPEPPDRGAPFTLNDLLCLMNYYVQRRKKTLNICMFQLFQLSYVINSQLV